MHCDLTCLEEHISLVQQSSQNFILMGDLNANLLSCNGNADSLLGLGSSLSLQPVHFSATHHTATTDTWIDVCLVDNLDKVVSAGQSTESFLSHHDLIHVKYYLPSFKHNNKSAKTIKYRDWGSVHTDTIMRNFNMYEWSLFIHCHDINHIVTAFT